MKRAAWSRYRPDQSMLDETRAPRLDLFFGRAETFRGARID
jgi:hypothetical protein